jgi:predicted molibdopterin-dependent oxidoreductase YjgC
MHLEADENDTVLKTARKHRIHIPTLCYHPALKPTGSCRLCAVEMENTGGRSHIMLGCALRVKAGMVIRTQSESVREARTKAMTRLIRMAPQARRLHDLAQREGIVLPPDSDGCIRCRLCIRVCKEVVGRSALRMETIDGHRHVMPVADRCIGCGTCANLCPTRVIQLIDRDRMRTVKINDVIIGTHPLERCEGCGRCYATEKQVHLVGHRTAPHTHVKMHHNFCPECAKLFSDRLETVRRHPPGK